MGEAYRRPKLVADDPELTLHLCVRIGVWIRKRVWVGIAVWIDAGDGCHRVLRRWWLNVRIRSGCLRRDGHANGLRRTAAKLHHP